MNWHYLQEQEAASWEGNCLDGAPSALLKLIPMPAVFCSQDKLTDASIRSPFGMTLRHSTAIRGVEELTWFQGDFPVKTYQQQEKEQDSTENDLDCGSKWQGSLAKCNPPTSGWKTAQYSLFGGLTEFSGTWPRWGMMQNGELSALTMPALRTNETEFGYLPTPTRADGFQNNPSYRRNRETWEKCTTLTALLLGKKFRLSGAAPRPKGKFLVMPRFVQWMMGWPDGWTNLDASGTVKFQQWLDLHGRL
jgi:hypothetical protein